MRQGGPDFHVIVQRAARRDARATQTYYWRESPRIAQDFAATLTHAIDGIGEAPQRWAEIDPGIRRYLLPCFPVSIVHRIVGSTVQILRILDQRRQPDTWRRRP